MNGELITVIRSLLGLFWLWVVVFYLWPDFRHDAFRNDLFSLRDEMFLYAAKGNIPFGHPAYTMLRTRMNRLLLHGHDFTLTRMIFVIQTHDLGRNEWLEQWEKVVAELPVDVQTVMRDFHLRVSIFVLQHVVFYSFFRYMLLRPLMVLIEVRNVMKSTKLTSGVEKLESETLEREAYLSDRRVTA